MSKTLEFRVKSLLTCKNGKITGPMSPVLFAEDMSEQDGIPFNRIGRVYFTDDAIFQHREEGGYTGHDTLILARYSDRDIQLTFWVDEGVRGVPVAMVFHSDRIVTMSQAYHKRQYAKTPRANEIKAILQFILEDPIILNPVEEQ